MFQEFWTNNHFSTQLVPTEDSKNINRKLLTSLAKASRSELILFPTICPFAAYLPQQLTPRWLLHVTAPGHYLRSHALVLIPFTSILFSCIQMRVSTQPLSNRSKHVWVSSVGRVQALDDILWHCMSGCSCL